MKINFSVADTDVEFIRDAMTGRAEVRTQSGTLLLQDPFNPTTHFSLSLIKEWRAEINGANILIQKKRPLFLAGLRPSRYRVFIDGALVTEQTGI